MRYLLAALAALLFAGTAEARWLVISKEDHGFAASNTNGIYDAGLIQQIAWRYGESVDVVRSSAIGSAAALQGIRRGRFLMPGNSDTTTYAVVLHTAFYTGSFSGNYRADSLTLTTYYPKVPQIFVGIRQSGDGFEISTACSTGVSGDAGLYAAADDSTLIAYRVGKPWMQWKGTALKFLTAATRDPRGWYPMVGIRTANKRNGAVLCGGISCNPDSTWDGTWPTNPDTLSMWAILMRDAAGARIGGNSYPAIFCQTSWYNSSSAVQPQYLMGALALADSVTGGAVFTVQSPRAIEPGYPRRAAMQIDDGWMKWGVVARTISSGWSTLDDTLLVRAGMDSMRTLGVPFSVGVDIDSLMLANSAAVVALGANHRREKDWWLRADPYVRFTPHSHSGLGGTTFRTPSAMIPTDLWGTAGSNIFVANPCGGSVNAINCKAARSFAILDSVFGKARVDHFGNPPTDDWTPNGVNIGHTTSSNEGAANLDSLWLAMRLGGYVGMRFNPHCAACNVSNNYGASGYYVAPRVIPVRLASPTGMPDMRGQNITLLATPGYQNQGASVAYSALTSTRAEYFWYSMFTQSTQYPGAVFGRGQTFSVPAHIYTMHVSDICGGDASGRATRPGFYAYKYFVRGMDMVNSYAIPGKALIQIVAPQELAE